MAELTPEISADDLRKFRIAYTAQAASEVLSIDFSGDGRQVLYSTVADIKMLRLGEGEPSGYNFEVNRHGAVLVKFLRSGYILHTSLDEHVIRMLDQRDPKKLAYACYFSAHKDEVHALSVSRVERNFFASGSRDKSVCGWDGALPRPVFARHFPAPPFVALHPLKSVLAVAYASDERNYVVEVLDLRKFEAVERLAVEDCGFAWCGIRYSNDGALLLANTLDSLVVVVDMEKLEVASYLRGLSNANKLPLQSCFAPDSRFVLGGSDDSCVHVWSLESSEKEFILESAVRQAFKRIEFSPHYMCFATAGDRFNLWREMDDDDVEEFP